MEFNIILICATRGFDLDKDVEIINIANSYLLTPKEKLFAKSVTENDLFKKQVGSIELEVLDNHPCFISFGNTHELFNNDSEYLNKSEQDAEVLQIFAASLWFIKDTCANTDKLYFVPQEKDDTLTRIRTVYFSNSKGRFTSTIFSNDEILKAKAVFDKIIEFKNNELNTYNTENNKDKSVKTFGGMSPGKSNYTAYNSINRISRAFTFLTKARAESFLPMKILFYASVLETFFTTGSTEISHKVAERLALYLGSNNHERMTYFKLTKKAYGVRSNYIHGQKLPKKLRPEGLESLSTEVDELVRKLMIKIVMIDSQTFLQDDASLNSYFDNLILKK